MSQTALSNVSIIPYMRAAEVEFSAYNLRPDRTARFFFDEVNVDRFVQKSSAIVANSANNVELFSKNEGVYSSTTRGFATVISTAPNNTLYVNENYISVNVATVGANTFAQSPYSIGDIVFQSNNIPDVRANTFSGRVEYWNSTQGVLALKPLNGTISSESASRILFKVGDTFITNVSNVVINSKFPAGTSVVSIENPGRTFVVDSYTHNHGVVSLTNPNSSQINVSTNVSSTVVGNNISITAGTGSEQIRQIVSITGNTVLTLNSAITNITGNSYYSIGQHVVDSFGDLAGIFNIPETEQSKFKTGERIFTITDASTLNDSDSTMRAASRYTASGILSNAFRLDQPERRATPVIEPPPPPVQSLEEEPGITPPNPTFVVPNRFEFFPWSLNIDPVAQTFFTPNPRNNKTDYGMFLSSVDLFFRQKPNAVAEEPEIPVTVRIVETLNGYPTNKIIATSTVDCKDVKITDGITQFPSISNNNSITKFKFEDPIYLESNGEYAIVVFSDSPSYEVWISELGQSIIGDPTGRRVSEQPYIGSFFRSQNASTWTPYQNQDLMFVINRAVFNSTPAVVSFRAEQQSSNVGMDDVVINSLDLNFPTTALQYKIKTVFGSTLQYDQSEIVLDSNKPFNFGGEGNTSVKVTGKSRIIQAGNANSFFMNVSLSTSDNSISPFFNKDGLSVVSSKNLINNGEISNGNIVIVDGGGSHINAANIVVTISDSDLYPGERATANVLPSGLVSGNVVAINIITPGRGYVTSPIITIIDPDVSASPNASVIFAGEDGSSGGNCLAKFITRKVTLLDGFDSGDLRIIVKAIRPQGTNIITYYKVLSESDPEPFDRKNWKRMSLVNNFLSKDLYTPVDFVYRPDPTRNKLTYIENDIEYPLGGKFKYFAIKVVMLSECSCISPTIENIKIISLPEG